MSALNTSAQEVWDAHFWGPVTATLDWCEANYQFTRYIAEAANTFSNLVTLVFACYGAHLVQGAKLPSRYLAGWTGFALVGLGSFIFHATLQYEAQLADELPMIYVASYCCAILFDIQPGFNIHNAQSRLIIAFLLAFNVLFTWSYAVYRNPIYHQVVFAILMFTNVFRTSYILRFSEAAKTIPDQCRTTIAWLFGTGAVTFAFGFLIWNLDNIFCSKVTQWKHQVGWPAAFLLEGHSWWHILTAVGTYLMLLGNTYLTLGVKDSFSNYAVNHKFGIPGLERVGKGKNL
ncbi:hypothetical protein EW026_g4126 [Hermanssonia centrifuga]|uniref:Alkaline phytoceramidase n=1 Tax=Hermanssonia centrifuga TaxID=98765 RepID=A0A4S4KI43_9APHY|nr:hypothetical protein EW026_g4126 [Hermanssonia centrifuga]